jgi:hypothetical protein
MFRSRAIAQGVIRPFHLLASMGVNPRQAIARLLDVSLEKAGGDRCAEAWLIINSDLRGLQARTHGPDRQLLPLRNHNWWEILLSIARRLGLSIYPGLSELEVERIVFDHLAMRVLRDLPSSERNDLEALALNLVSVTDALRRLGLSAEGTGFVLAALHRMSQAAPGLRRMDDPLDRTRAFLGSNLVERGMMPSISRTFRFLRERLDDIADAWSSMDAVRSHMGRSLRAVLTTLAVLHLFSALEEATEEVEALRL